MVVSVAAQVTGGARRIGVQAARGRHWARGRRPRTPQEEVVQEGHAVGDIQDPAVVDVARLQAGENRPAQEEEVQEGDGIGYVALAVVGGIPAMEEHGRRDGEAAMKSKANPTKKQATPLNPYRCMSLPPRGRQP